MGADLRQRKRSTFQHDTATKWQTGVDPSCGSLACRPCDRRLAGEIRKLLLREGLLPNSLSIYAKGLGKPTPLISNLADAPRNPASVTKLLTTYSALE